MTPTPAQVYEHHWRHGGLWRIIPARTEKGQPRPLFAKLTVSVGISGPTFIWYEGGDMAATIKENANLQGAEWVPVDSRGDRV